MKTLSQVRAEEQLRANKVVEDLHDRRVRLAEAARGVSPIDARSANEIHDSLMRDAANPVDIACDNCGTELVATHPNIVLTSSPPMYNIGCPGCGWRGYKTC